MLTTQKQRDLFESGTRSANRVAKFMSRRLRCKLYDADDATQDSLIGLAEACESYDEDKATCPFRVYANTKCRQKILDGWRKAMGRTEGKVRFNSAKTFSELAVSSRRYDDAANDPFAQRQTLHAIQSSESEPIDILIFRADEARKRRMAARIKRLADDAGRSNGRYGGMLAAIFDFGMSHTEAAALYGVSLSSVSNLLKHMRTEALCA
jgi:RNA polymerase sigma factor (sigma-70 family)